MKTPINSFKQGIKEGRTQYGLWVSLLGPLNTEICAAAGFDWLLLDGEHTPNDPYNLLQQSQVIAAYPKTHAIARVPIGHGFVGQGLLKQYLDVGIQTVLVPMVETADQAYRLHKMGYRFAQGFHFARPMPGVDIALLLDVVPASRKVDNLH